MYYSNQSVLSTSFSFSQRILFYLVVVVVSIIGISYLYIPNFVAQQFDCNQECLINDVIMDLYGMSDVTDGIMKQINSSQHL